MGKGKCQCPLGLIPHFYVLEETKLSREAKGVNALSGLYLISTIHRIKMPKGRKDLCVNALSGLYLISTFTRILLDLESSGCQCPLGLIPHFYGLCLLDRVYDHETCQCPLGLIPHFYGTPSKT